MVGGPGPGSSGSGELELRRSSRARRAPVMLDVSPAPPKKRRRIEKNVILSAEKSVKDEDSDTPGSWRSRLRSRGRNAGSVVKGKRKLFEETGGGRSEENMMSTESNDKNGGLEGGRPRIVKSNRPGRIRATNSLEHEKKENELPVIKDELVEEEVEVMRKDEDVSLQLDSELDSGFKGKL
ncbi:uncharacterized protein Pyn_11760 [Prunus yedoensis var. nudiflora]|uniref:Uncharacterized protein n=1 Tax=Prunus yedoensis var. nudiflora TaxID=2094558 RepID=A0A314UMN0_PRUYE|nr:uncharacterized protein Pyn_11760 [Prunus yedoensis var. nudiflora]